MTVKPGIGDRWRRIVVGIGTSLKPLLPAWRRGGALLTVAALRRCIDLQFLYRGVSTLELRTLDLNEHRVEVAFYARPVFPGDRRIQQGTREAAFAEQLFQDAVTVLDTLWRHAEAVQTVTVSVWLRTLDGVGQELPVLRTEATRQQADALPGRGRLGPMGVLRCYTTRTRIDRHGHLHAERAL